MPAVPRIPSKHSAAQAKGEASEGASAPLAKGVELVIKQFVDALRKQGVHPVETELGQVFDPNFHQPLLQEAAEGKAEGVILEVLQKGYRLGDRLLRPSMVKVAAAA